MTLVNIDFGLCEKKVRTTCYFDITELLKGYILAFLNDQSSSQVLLLLHMVLKLTLQWHVL